MPPKPKKSKGKKKGGTAPKVTQALKALDAWAAAIDRDVRAIRTFLDASVDTTPPPPPPPKFK